MATPSAELRGFFAQVVNDARQEEFLTWLAGVDEQVRSICEHATKDWAPVPHHAPWSVLDFTNPGWDQLWEQDASIATAIDHLLGLDFEFEAMWEAWKTCQT